MKKREIINNALINATSTFLYIVLVVLFISFMNDSPMDGNNSLLIPIFMLMLFIFSASLTGYLVLGQPFIWFFDGKKREAVKLFVYTLAIFFVIMIITFLVYCFQHIYF